MSDQESEGKRIGESQAGWWKRSYFNIVFNLMSALYFVITGYLLLFSEQWSATGRAGVSFLCAFSCALIGNLDKFESVKASISGIEAKTREIARAVDEARVALNEFHVLAELTGSFLIELMTGAGRFGGSPPDYHDERRTRIIGALTAIGLDPAAVKRVNSSDSYWVRIDYTLGILQGIPKSTVCSAQLKAAASEMLQRWNNEAFRPTPDDIARMLEHWPSADSHILNLVEDYRYYVANGEHRRPAVWRDRHAWPR